jgi:hypothetical protein
VDVQKILLQHVPDLNPYYYGPDDPDADRRKPWPGWYLAEVELDEDTNHPTGTDEHAAQQWAEKQILRRGYRVTSWEHITPPDGQPYWKPRLVEQRVKLTIWSGPGEDSVTYECPTRHDAAHIIRQLRDADAVIEIPRTVGGDPGPDVPVELTRLLLVRHITEVLREVFEREVPYFVPLGARELEYR